MLRKRYFRKPGAFTLVELMVVIVIMVLLAGMSIPVMNDFLRSRRLRSAGDRIQTSCMKARSAAIAQREEQMVVFFANAASNQYTFPAGTPWGGGTVQGAVNSIHSFDSNESEPTPLVRQVGEAINLPEFVSFEAPTANFAFVFHPDGTVETLGYTNNADLEPESDNTTEMRLLQNNDDIRCYADMASNTGRLRYAVRYPNEIME